MQWQRNRLSPWQSNSHASAARERKFLRHQRVNIPRKPDNGPHVISKLAVRGKPPQRGTSVKALQEKLALILHVKRQKECVCGGWCEIESSLSLARPS